MMNLAISRQIQVHDAEGQRPSEVDRPELKKKKAAEQMQRVGQNSVSEEVSVPDKVAKAEPSADRFVRSDGSGTNAAGTYSLKKDGNGNPKIVYQKPAADTDTGKENGKANETSGQKENPLVSPKKPEDKPNQAPGNTPAKTGGGLECKVNTDKVDAEIKNLKKEKQQIEQEMKQASGDEDKKKELEERLKEIDDELRTKDTDAYRKQNATYTYKSV